jgi:GNAT superfamily N-acetyltransferase
MNIERITKESVGHVLPLLEAQFVEHDIDMKGEALERSVRGLVDVPGRGIILAAREAERTVGVAVLSFTWSLEMGGLTSWLEELYVVPERRNGGLGTRLLHDAIAAAKNEGCGGVDLEVESDHARAERLYLREGFTRRTRNRFVRSLQEEVRGAR